MSVFMDIDLMKAILPFAGGLLIFVATIINLVVRFWEHKDPDSRKYFLSSILPVFAFIVFLVGLATRYLGESF